MTLKNWPWHHHAPGLTIGRRKALRGIGFAGLALGTRSLWALPPRTSYDLRDFGAAGDGRTLDTVAIQRAIDAAADGGGGVVVFPAGTYLSFSLRLRSHVTLQLTTGSVLLAATSLFRAGSEYDLPEAQSTAIQQYQDYGHNHWHNSLLWGEGLEDIAILGPGLMWGRGLNKGDGPAEERVGAGNKVIALKNCRNVLLRDLTMKDAGHFGVLASGVDNLTIDNLRIDTRRDGIDIDGCRSVHIANCTVNAPWDDAIVLKSSYSLGELRSTERVTIDNCIVTGCYQMGTTLDSSYLRFPKVVPQDAPSYVGRIKIGTETNGDVRNVVVSNCVLEGCHGLAVECEDGGHVTDVRYSNITMRDMVGPPFFVRLGSRMRAPAGTRPGSIERIAFDGVDCWNSTSEDCSVLAGMPGNMIRDLSFANIFVEHQGGGHLRHGELPEAGSDYPEPHMFGPTPAQGFYVRHVDGLRMTSVQVRAKALDPRPLIVFDDVAHAHLREVEGAAGQPTQMEGRGLTDVYAVDDEGRRVSIGAYKP